MNINSVNQFRLNQLSFQKKEKNNKQEEKSYLKTRRPIGTKKKIKPLPPKGHLVDDSFSEKIKYVGEDIKYELNSVKNGYNGVAKDHQLGRLNDVGLKLGGLTIAAYLASRTQNPKARLMEYLGFGTFLASMSLYPKLALNAPARAIHGFDFDKEFIDDQGRKKSVFQDSNYIPYDMYTGNKPSEDLSIIGDKLGIPRNIKNRDEVTKEQMRKIATQNNTLWMLTAGFATPVMTALICNRLESPVSSMIEFFRNSNCNSAISSMLKKTANMSLDISSVKNSELSKSVNNFLAKNKGKELSQKDYEELSKLLTENFDSIASDGIRADLKNIVSNGFQINDDIVLKMQENSRKVLNGRNKETLDKYLMPTKEEIIKAFGENYSKGVVTQESVLDFNNTISKIIDAKLSNVSGIPQEFIDLEKTKILKSFQETIESNKSRVITDDAMSKINSLAKILGEFKENALKLDKYKSFKVEYSPETALGNSYGRFEKLLFKNLKISFKDIKMLKNADDNVVREFLDKKIADLCSNDAKFEKMMRKMAKAVSKVDTRLDGTSARNSHMLNLVNAIENNYNNTAKRLYKADSTMFANTIDRLVKADASGELAHTVTTKAELIDAMDGVTKNAFENVNWHGMSDDEKLKYYKYNADGVGSSKRNTIARIYERNQNVRSIYNRFMQTFDVYKRSINAGDLGTDKKMADEVIALAKETLLKATTTSHIMKMDTVNSPEEYKALMDFAWATEGDGINIKGKVSESTKKALGTRNSVEKGNVLTRFQNYIAKIKTVIANNRTDFTKPHHILNENASNIYKQGETTLTSIYNLVGQSPVEFVRKAAERRYAPTKWLRIMTTILGSVVGVAVLAQFTFKKIRNPQNMQKQVKYVNNK